MIKNQETVCRIKLLSERCALSLVWTDPELKSYEISEDITEKICQKKHYLYFCRINFYYRFLDRRFNNIVNNNIWSLTMKSIHQSVCLY